MQNKDLNKILALDNAWSTVDVLKKLIEAANILLHEKNYDRIGWEEISICVDIANERVLIMENVVKEKIL